MQNRLKNQDNAEFFNIKIFARHEERLPPPWREPLVCCIYFTMDSMTATNSACVNSSSKLGRSFLSLDHIKPSLQRFCINRSGCLGDGIAISIDEECSRQGVSTVD